jgi:hypothetical protein
VEVGTQEPPAQPFHNQHPGDFRAALLRPSLRSGVFRAVRGKIRDSCRLAIPLYIWNCVTLASPGNEISSGFQNILVYGARG